MSADGSKGSNSAVQVIQTAQNNTVRIWYHLMTNMDRDAFLETFTRTLHLQIFPVSNIRRNFKAEAWGENGDFGIRQHRLKNKNALCVFLFMRIIYSFWPSVYWKDRVQLNCSAKASRKGCVVSETETSFSSSRLKVVTPLPTIPQGTTCSNQVRSVLQFNAKPCEVMYLPQCIPEKNGIKLNHEVPKYNTWIPAWCFNSVGLARRL